MGTIERARHILAGLKEAGIKRVASVPDINMLQFGIPMLLLIYYAGDMGDNAFHMVGLVTEPVLQGLGIKYTVMRDPAKVKQDIAGAVIAARSSKRPVALLLTRAVL